MPKRRGEEERDEYQDKYVLLLENCVSEHGRREEKNEWEEKRREEVFIHLAEQLMAVPVYRSLSLSLSAYAYVDLSSCHYLIMKRDVIIKHRSRRRDWLEEPTRLGNL